MSKKKFDTDAVRSGYQRTEQQEHSEAIFTTSSFVFDSAEQAEKRFSNQEKGNVYSRFTNPTVDAFERKLASLENGESCVATASGMSSIFATIMGLLSPGDHIVASRSMFGTTIILLDKIVSRFGIEVDYVNLSDINEWKVAIKSNTKMFLLETPSNPLGEVIDISNLSKLSKTNDILLAVDNCLLTPALQKPLDLGADISIQSATKYIDGQGRSLAGAVISNQKIIDEIRLFTRSTGPTLSPFNAWVVLKGLETLRIRMEAHGSNALKFANWLQNHKEVKKVFYTGLESHPHHEIAKKQQEGFGGIVSFEVQGGKAKAFDVINNVKIMSISANLGDTKTTITHPASTTHGRLSPEQRLKSGITDSLLRVSVGLEDIDDLINDMNNALLV